MMPFDVSHDSIQLRKAPLSTDLRVAYPLQPQAATPSNRTYRCSSARGIVCDTRCSGVEQNFITHTQAYVRTRLAPRLVLRSMSLLLILELESLEGVAARHDVGRNRVVSFPSNRCRRCGCVGPWFLQFNVFFCCRRLFAVNSYAQPTQGDDGGQPIPRHEMVQIFRKSSGLGPQEASFYLETNAWNLTEALAEWREENRWELEQVRGCCMLKRACITPPALLWLFFPFDFVCVHVFWRLPEG